MSRFHYRLACIGGSAQMWGCETQFDGLCEEACSSISAIGASVHTGCELWQQMEMYDMACKEHTRKPLHHGQLHSLALEGAP
eukprot:2644071-Karenia_brevis.AAC.1